MPPPGRPSGWDGQSTLPSENGGSKDGTEGFCFNHICIVMLSLSYLVAHSASEGEGGGGGILNRAHLLGSCKVGKSRFKSSSPRCLTYTVTRSA